MRQPNQLQQLAGALIDLLFRPAAQVQRNGDVFEAIERGQQIEKLKNEPDLVAAQARQLVVGKAAQPAAIDFDFAGGRRVEAADQVQQRRFAGAGRSDDGDHLAARDLEIHRIQRRDLRFPLEDFADLSESNHLLAIMSYRDTSLHMRIGIDAGGTFTDFIVYHDDGRLETFKLRSNPRSPASVILAGLAQAAGSRKAEVIHGSTVATNALLERKGVRTALVTTAGFEDVIHIGRQNRPELYNLTPRPKVPIIPRAMCFGVRERAWFDGTIAEKPRRNELARLKTRLRRARVESIAICFLHAYRTPANEKAVAQALDGLGYLCCSHDVCPEFREYERSSTTLINAYIGPLMDRYLGELEGASRHSISIMQSNGGFMSTREARRHAIRTVLSGPAGGVIGALEAGRLAGFTHILGFDMGGTSTDVSLCDGVPRETMEASIDGFPVRVPMLDIHTVGAGGGSIARVDEGGLLRVGPESAGADPGPACYGIGDRPTVTDAHVVLGRIAADQLVGGEMHLDVARASGAIDSIARELKISRVAAAAGIVRVANANMERAIRVVSVERGHDPRDFALIAFGGCGGLHACEMAERAGHPHGAGARVCRRAVGAGDADRRSCARLRGGRFEPAGPRTRVRAPGTHGAEGVARRGIRPIGRRSLRGPELRADGSMACGEPRRAVPSRAPARVWLCESRPSGRDRDNSRAREVASCKTRAGASPGKGRIRETNAAPNLCGGRMARDAGLHARPFVEHGAARSGASDRLRLNHLDPTRLAIRARQNRHAARVVLE